MIGFPFSFEAAFEVLAKGVRSAQSSNGYHNNAITLRHSVGNREI
jgi:hypothetical protein